jgi:hypothetical protein
MPERAARDGDLANRFLVFHRDQHGAHDVFAVRQDHEDGHQRDEHDHNHDDTDHNHEVGHRDLGRYLT